MKPQFKGTCQGTIKKYNLLRHYNDKKGKSTENGMIIAGVSPMAAGKTRDGYYSTIFANYLKNAENKFQVGSKTVEGVDPSKPLFCHIRWNFTSSRAGSSRWTLCVMTNNDMLQWREFQCIAVFCLVMIVY